MEIWIRGSVADASSVNADAVIVSSSAARVSSSSRPRVFMEQCEKTLVDSSSPETACCAIARDQFEALAAVGSVPWVLYEVSEDGRACMIGLENVISAAKPAGTKVAAAVEIADDVVGAAFALDIGVDALVLPAKYEDSLGEAALIARAQRAERSEEVEETTTNGRRPISEITGARVESIVPGVVGDRVAIDLVRLLQPGEGALVGSSSKALALVHGETLPSSLVAPRPFRVNAGPVHAYVLLANGKTKYLSELRPGDEILVVNANARSARPVAVGRLKIETRPHLLISFVGNAPADAGQIFLQQAETVRMVTERGPTGSVEADGVKWDETSVTALRPGDVVAASFSSDYGTHCGVSIAARVVER